MTTAITKAAPSFEFTQEQRRIILDSFLNGASEAEAAVLMELARCRRLNPITQQIHFVKRWNSQRRAEVWQAQVGIDGFRAIAERTGLYDGQDEPENEYDSKGALKLCKVRVYRKDWSRPAVGVAHFSEYAQTKKEGGLTVMWATKPHIMLAKCAEALAFRKAFPEDTSGLYAPEEMGDAPTEREINPPLSEVIVAAGQISAPVDVSPRKTQTEKVKEKLKANKPAPAQQAEPTEEEIVTPFQAFAALAREFHMDLGALAGRAQGVLGKTAGFTHADIAMLRSALVAVPPRGSEA